MHPTKPVFDCILRCALAVVVVLQELLALGLSNIVGGSFSCIVCTASLSRSAVYEAVGARTQVS